MFLTVTPQAGGDPLRIPVAYAGGDGDAEVGQDLVGDPGDFAPNGDYCSTQRARPLRIPVTTRPLTAAEAAELRAVLEGPVPMPFGGEFIELLGRDPEAFDGIPSPVAQQQVSLAAGRHVVLRFELAEFVV